MRRVLCTLSTVVAASVALLPSAAAQCVTGGTGGALAGTGATAGVWDTTLPSPAAFSSTLAVTVPGGATVLTSVKLFGVTHTWSGDTHWVLQDPSGNNYNLLVRSDATSPGGGGCANAFGGDYEIVDPITGSTSCVAGNPLMGCPGGTIPTGVYVQDFSTWTCGNAGLNNTALESIPIASGTWTLTVYDWYPAGDNGTLGSWDLCFGSPTTPPVQPLPGAPTLVSPPDTSSVANPVTLTWSAATCAGTYEVDVDGIVNCPQTGLTSSFGGAPGTHTWRVRALNSAGPGPWTPTWTFDFGAPPPPMVCVTGGAGGIFPTQTTVNGTWPTALPPGQLDAPLAVTIPAGATKVLAVKLFGFAHGWYDDPQFVLEDPSGGMHNLFQANNGVGGGTCGDDYSGDYVIVDAVNGQDPGGGPAANFSCGSGSIAPGTYRQEFGTWPTGSSGIDNTPLETIPIGLPGSSGTWTLHCYDWFVGADGGSFASWDLCFDTPVGPSSYCTAGTSTSGCVPSISGSAQPSVSLANPCNVSIANVEGQKFGIIFYGINQTGFTPSPWAIGSNSFLCVKGPTQRTGSSSSGGTLGLCDGTLSLDWNAYQSGTPGALGQPWAAGNKAYVQGWYRDPPAPKTTNLSNALEMTYLP